MPNRWRKNYLLILSLVLLICTVFIIRQDWQNSHRRLTFAVLDVGQGDALFIESPTGTQILVDGGPAKKVLSQLPRLMPFYDRKIDMVIITNPDADHMAGFLDVFKNYKVGAVIEPGTWNDSSVFTDLKKEITRKNIPNLLARRGMKIDLGGGAYIEILFPDRNVGDWSTNDGSVMMRLVYGETSVMLAGDTTSITEKIVLAENAPEKLRSDILKVGHHGSRTSSSPEFVKAVAPEFAAISLGKDNSYGHPHKETLDTLKTAGAQMFRTDLLGTIIMKSDGRAETFRFLR